MRKWYLPIGLAAAVVIPFSSATVTAFASSVSPADSPAGPACAVTSAIQGVEVVYGNSLATFLGCPTTSDNCQKDDRGECKVGKPAEESPQVASRRAEF